MKIVFEIEARYPCQVARLLQRMADLASVAIVFNPVVDQEIVRRGNEEALKRLLGPWIINPNVGGTKK